MYVHPHPVTYNGYNANERPCQFVLDEETYEIKVVLHRWYEPSATYFKVRATDEKTYLLRYDEREDEWTLQSAFDADELLARPSIRSDHRRCRCYPRSRARDRIVRILPPGDVEIPFDWILADVLNKRGPIEFILREMARCPNCKHILTEKREDVG